MCAILQATKPRLRQRSQGFATVPFLTLPEPKIIGASLQRLRLRSVMLRSPEHGPLYSFFKLSAYALGVLLIGTTGTQDAVANGDTRTIYLVHIHTKETANITFKRNGTYDFKALQQLNWFLRDWRTDQPTKMEPRLFDIVWEVYRSVGASEGVPRRVRLSRAQDERHAAAPLDGGVENTSQHMAGKAMDMFLPGVDIAKVRATAMRLQYGGVGFYGETPPTPSSTSTSGACAPGPASETRGAIARPFPGWQNGASTQVVAHRCRATRKHAPKSSLVASP